VLKAHAKKSPGAGLCPQALGELGELYQRALIACRRRSVRSRRTPRTVNSMRRPIDPGDFGLTDDPAPDRCRGQVRDIDVRANRR